MKKVLFSIEKFLDAAHPEWGHSINEYGVVGSLASSDMGVASIFYYDEFLQTQPEQDVNAALIKKCEQSKPDMVLATWIIQNGERNVKPETYGHIRDELKIPVAMYWGESAPDVVRHADIFAPHVTVNVFIETKDEWRKNMQHPEKCVRLFEPRDAALFNSTGQETRDIPLSFLGTSFGRMDRALNLAFLKGRGIGVFETHGQKLSGLAPIDYVNLLRRSLVTISFSSAITFQHITGRTIEAAMCFPKGTKIITGHFFPRGGYCLRNRNIEHIKTGDLVLTFNTRTSAKELKPVLGVTNNMADEFIDLTFSNGKNIRVTPEHPFAQISVDGIKWIEAAKLRIGSKLLSKSIRISGTHAGSIPWNKGLTKDTNSSVAACARKVKLYSVKNYAYLAKRLAGKGGWAMVWADPARRKRMSDKSRQRWSDPAYRHKTLEVLDKHRKEAAESTKRRWLNSEFRQDRIKAISKDMLRLWADPSRKTKMSASMKARWTDPVYKNRLMLARERLWSNAEFRERTLKLLSRAWHRRPTRPELKLDNLLRRLCPGEFKYNGNSVGIVLGGYIPDFVNINGKKKIIDLFGCYWHCCKDCGQNDREGTRRFDRNRTVSLLKIGWEHLVVWEHELANIDSVGSKIENFLYNPGVEVITVTGVFSVTTDISSVFNLTVAENNNYFAGGILCHNCGSMVLESENGETPELLDPYADYVPFKEPFHYTGAGQVGFQDGDLAEKALHYAYQKPEEARKIAESGRRKVTERCDGREFWTRLFEIIGI